MTYFAIGESTGGAGERRLGPFDTPEEAAQAGRKETKESNGAFVFRGVVDEANNQVGFDIEPIVSTNAVVMNALTANRRVAKNAVESKQFGNVIARANEFEGFGISLASISHRAEGNTAKECVSEAKKMLAEYEKAVSGMKQAISWMEQSAK